MRFLFPHPVYGGRHWLCVLDPDRTWPTVHGLLTGAHAFAVGEYDNPARRARS